MEGCQVGWELRWRGEEPVKGTRHGGGTMGGWDQGGAEVADMCSHVQSAGGQGVGREGGGAYCAVRVLCTCHKQAIRPSFPAPSLYPAVLLPSHASSSPTVAPHCCHHLSIRVQRSACFTPTRQYYILPTLCLCRLPLSPSPNASFTLLLPVCPQLSSVLQACGLSTALKAHAPPV